MRMFELLRLLKGLAWLQVIYLSVEWGPAVAQDSSRYQQQTCHSVLFNFTTLVRLTGDRTCGDVCKDAFEIFETILKTSSTKLATGAKVGLNLSLPPGRNNLADDCMFIKKLCFNGRHASEPFAKLVIEGQRALIKEECSEAFETCVSKLDPESTALGCYCTQALAVFSIARVNHFEKLFSHCEPPLVCHRLAAFVSGKSAPHDSRWWCIDDQYEIIEERVKCHPDSYTAWCAECNLPRCAIRKRFKLECPNLMPFNATDFEAWQIKRKQAEAEILAASRTTYVYGNSGKKRQRKVDSRADLGSDPIVPIFESSQIDSQSRGAIIGEYNWPDNQRGPGGKGRPYPPNQPNFHGASTSGSVANQDPEVFKHHARQSAFKPYQLSRELKLGSASKLSGEAERLDEIPTVGLPRRSESDSLYDYQMQQAIQLSLARPALPPVDTALRLGQPTPNLPAEGSEIDCNCERICEPPIEAQGPSIEESEDFTPFSFL